jgi:HSP20 family protein
MAAPTRQNDTAITRWTPAAELDRISQELSPTVGRAMDAVGDSRARRFNVETDGRRIVVSGERKDEKRSGPLRRRTRSWGEFRYEVILPEEVDEEHVEATMCDGVLHLRAPKQTAGTQRRRIEIK